MATATADTTLAGRLPVAGVEQRKLRPVMFWALLGSMFLALMFYMWIRTAAEGELTPTTTGRETASDWSKISVHGQEILLGSIALAVIWWFLIRPWRREGRLTLDGMMVIAWATLYLIQDPWVSWSQSTITYNSTAVNVGCPQCHVPGWNSNQALAEPIIWGLGCYIGPMFLWCVMANALQRRAQLRWPRMGKFGLVMVAIVFMAVGDLILEVFWTRTGVYTYGGGDPDLSLFDDTYYKYPLWVGAIWGIAWGLIASLRFFKDDQGRTVVERGVDDVKTSPKKKQWLRLLAIIGAMNASFAFVYNVPVQHFSSHASAFPDDLLDRPYLLGGVCGAGTSYACPDDRIPIPRGEKSGRVLPDGTFQPPKGGLPNQLPDN